MRFAKLTLLLSLFFSLPSAKGQLTQQGIFADADRTQRVESLLPLTDSIFSKYASQQKFPSISYGLVMDGKLIHTFYKGLINISKNIPADNSSDYHIASMTKSITAMAILKLRDEGKLSLDDPIDKYIPEARGLKELTTDAPPITIRQLLTHNAGFPEDNPWGDRQLGRSVQWLKDFYKSGISFSTTPGTDYEYSNLGFGTLGLIIQNVSGQTYQQYITQHILHPLGMTHTYWDYEEVPENQLAIGYRIENGQWVPQPLLHSGIFGAMGGLITTLEDFSKYMIFQLSAWPPRDDRETGPVKRNSVREMQHGWNFAKLWKDEKNFKGDPCVVMDFYGYGLHEYLDCNGLKIITHSGGLPGFGSQWRILPDYGIGLVVFANQTYASLGTPLNAAIDTLLLKADLQPRILQPSAILEKRREQLIALLPDWKGAEQSGIFADNFFNDYFLSALKKQSTELFGQAGRILGTSKVSPLNQLRGSFKLIGNLADIQITFTLSPETDPKIQAFKMLLIKK